MATKWPVEPLSPTWLPISVSILVAVLRYARGRKQHKGKGVCSISRLDGTVCMDGQEAMTAGA